MDKMHQLYAEEESTNDFRFDDLDIVFFELAAHVLERVCAISSNDGAAGTSELGGSAELTRDLHHAPVFLALGPTADFAAQIEVAVQQRGQEIILMRGERVADLVGQFRPFANGGVNFRNASLVVEREAAVEDLGAFREVGPVGDEERQVVRDVDRLVDAVAELLHVVLVEVHVDRRLVGLRHTVLKSCLDAEFIKLDGKHKIRQDRLRNIDLEEPDHGAHGGRDDCGRTGHAEAVRDVRLIAQREVIVTELDVLLHAVGVEGFHAGFEQADAAVVAELRDAAREVRHVLVGIVIQHGRQDLEVGRFIERDLGAVVAEHERDGLAEISVGRVADERGARICLFTDDHGIFSSINAE